jgi:YgiT-type zinc finger domain-containing protein
MMDCVMCDGNLVETTRPKAVERDGRIAVIRDVPVHACDSCGEVYLDADVALQLDVLFRRLLDGPVDEVVGHYESAAA